MRSQARDVGSWAVVAAFRLGLSWIVGRRWLLLTTTEPATGAPHRAVLPFRFESGELYVTATPDAAWVEHLDTRPVAMAQAAPGPLAVRATRQGDDIALVATGQPAPPPVVPDLNWVLPAVLAASALANRLWRSRAGRSRRW